VLVGSNRGISHWIGQSHRSMADADVPNIASVASRILCDHTRYCVQYLVDGLHGLQQFNGNLMDVLNVIRDDVKHIKSRDDGSARLWPAPPAMIMAVGSHTCSSSSNSFPSSKRSSPSSSSDRRSKRVRSVARSEHDVWVKCPFCPQEHWNERSHVQHVQRSVDR
jgi:hypothetical protein